MRPVAIMFVGFVFCTFAHAADDPNRAALISRIEVQYAAASVVGADSPIVEMILSSARPLNPNTEDTTWKEIRTEVAASLTSTLTEKGGALDVLLRGALDPLSTAELKRLSSLLSDPVYKKFQGTVLARTVRSG